MFEMTVDINAVEEFVESEKFTRFLLDNAEDFTIAAFVLNAVLNEIENVKNS